MNNNDSVIVLTDENGEFVVKGKNHPDNIIHVNLSDEEFSDNEDNASNANNNGVKDELKVEKILPSKKSRKLSIENYARPETVSLVAKRGIIKEYIETTSLGIIFHEEEGNVLFHVDHVYINGITASARQLEDFCKPGTEVFYCELKACHPAYYIVSPNNVIRQAVGVWQGVKPLEIVKLARQEDHLDTLQEHREEFLSFAESGAFVELGLCRVKGYIIGYFSDVIGVIQVSEGEMKHSRVLFHKDDVYLFREKLKDRDDLAYVMPIGLHVYVDAKSLGNEQSEARDYHEIEYQACLVLHGTWPKVPHPTAFPQGKGTFAPTYDTTDTFYYLSGTLDWNLKLRLRRFEGFYADKQFMWVDPEWRIRNGRDYANWKSMFAPKYIQIRHANRPRHRYNGEKSRTAHCFGESSQVKLEVKNEFKQEFKTEKIASPESRELRYSRLKFEK